ncbi:MAG: lipid-A-disaccharide synthase [Gammaproteobacteria bacterium]|nr:lipid-A-disaccharide synthase [Gammaproteobacteria bacterium]
MPGQSVFIVAGEASGDLHASHLARKLLSLDSTLTLKGMGGDNMRRAGVDILFDASELAVVGLFEVLANYRTIKGVLDKIKQNITASPPDLLILVDYQEFNQRLAAYAKSIGVKVLFYIGPQVWAWRPKRVYKMGAIVDQMAVIFPFEVELYKDAKVPVEFTGHPLVEEAVPDKSPSEARELLELDDVTTIGLFPGSRRGEINRVLPIQLKAAKRLLKQNPDYQFVLPLAESLNEDVLDPYLEQIFELRIAVIEGKTYDVMQACDAIITASGTATLEIALMGVPMAIVYKISWLSYFILKFMVSIDHIGLVNIVADKMIVREFLQGQARPKKISDEILHILTDKNYNETMRRELSLIRDRLGDSGGTTHVAQLAYDMLDKKSANERK